MHIKCNKINLQTYKFLQKSPSAWFCTKCFEDIVPFGTISNEELFKTNQGFRIKFTVLTKHHTPPSQDLIDQLNEAMGDPSSDTVSSKYYKPCELLSLLNNSKNVFHLNISSLSFHIEELTTHISEHNLTFDIFGVSETKLRLNKAPLNFEFTATECNNGGTAIYIKKGLNYKLRKDLDIYKSKQLEATFIEVNLKNEKIVIGCIYRHPSMELSEFNNNYLTNLLDILSSENKTVVLPGDFNADLLKYDQNSNISDFLDLMYSSILLPHIFSPTCTASSSATLIDNIIINNCNSFFVSGNLVNTLSDHHAQFLIMGNQHSPLELDSKSSETSKRFRNIYITSSVLENKDWVSELRLSRNDVNLPSELVLRNVVKLKTFWAPLQKVSNKHKKLLNKPWLTSGILKSIEIKNRLHKRM